jgi:hypothetical protein
VQTLALQRHHPCAKQVNAGTANRLKTLKRAMYGRAGIELLKARMLPLEPT